MSPISRKRLSKNNTDHTLRDLVKALTEVNASRVRSQSEEASEMSKRISHNKPSPFDRKGEPSKLENRLREFDNFLTWRS